jgi:hypothetical protein
VGVKEPTDIGRIRGRIASLGVPANAAIVEVASGAITTTTLTDHFAEAIGGIRITGVGVGGCTLGVNAYTPQGGRTFITASHCTLVNGPDPVPTMFYQPNMSVYPFLIGTETGDNAGTDCGSVAPGYMCRWSDAALVRYWGSGWKFGYLASTYSGNTYIGTTPIQGLWTSELMIGDRVTRMGATSGRATGPVIETCANVKSYTPAGVDRLVIIGCAVRVSAPVSGGDSGGPVYRMLGIPSPLLNMTFAWFMGIEFGGDQSLTTYYFSRFRDVDLELGYPLGGNLNVVAMRAGISGPTVIQNAGSYTWQADACCSTLTSDPQYTYKWEHSYDNANWSAVSTSSTYSITILSIMPKTRIPFYLRVTVTGGPEFGQTATSDVYTVVVQAPLF